ncbi:MAG: hypothetical protein HY606_06485 [Planctomycetes bacterium]|nr:hypothetical protein [Planctomycetota bacterium]
MKNFTLFCLAILLSTLLPNRGIGEPRSAIACMEQAIGDSEAELTVTADGYITNLLPDNTFTTENADSLNLSIWPIWSFWYMYAVNNGCITYRVVNGITFTEVDCNCLEKLFGKNHPFYKYYCSWIQTPPVLVR